MGFSSRSVMTSFRCPFLSLLLFCATFPALHAQEDAAPDSTTAAPATADLLDHLGIRYVRVSAAHIFSPAATGSLHAEEPEYLHDMRAERGVWHTDYYSILDNPLYHGATWVDLETELRPYPGFFLTAGITAENRGISYGLNSTKNNVMLLRYHIGIDTNFRLLGERFGVRASVGDSRDARVDEGLLFTHADIQGALVRLDWRKLAYRYVKVGDAFAGLGLNIDDADYHLLGLNNVAVIAGWKGSINAGFFNHALIGTPEFTYEAASPRYALLKQVGLQDFGYTLSGSLTSGDSLYRVYAQGGLREADVTDYLMNRMAFVAGASARFESGNVELSATGEYRYYGGLFNAGYRNTDVYYRDPEIEQSWGNTVGPHLYQLAWFERPFSQWGVFSEYQNLKDVTGWTLYGKGKWFFYDRFLVRGMLDLNYIVPEKLDPFLYPFYDIGIGWEPFDKFSLVFSLTNKGMNLDKHYPTFYLYEHPVPSIAFRWNVE